MRKASIARLVISTMIGLATALYSFAIDTKDTALLTQPAIGAKAIAFVYANDLWIADLDGRNPRRLTTDVGQEMNPAFSPDGDLLAFSGQYDGNLDVYVVPVSGGVPKRLTWHPGPDTVQGFTPDGKSVLFTSPRFVFSNRHQQLFTVPIGGGAPEQLKIPQAFRASISPDGARIAYNHLYDAFLQWKHYRGGTVSTIWIFDTRDNSVVKVPQPEGRSNDPGPMWIGDKIFFRSDRNGEFNIFAYDSKSKAVTQVTDHKDFPVLNASAGAGKIIYEQAGRLHVLDPGTGKSTRLVIGVAADLAELRERFASGGRWIRNADISPSGARALFEFRGEVVTVPAEKGDPRNLTETPGAHERSPVWSPDGKSIAYFTDESGEYELAVRSQDGKGEAKRYKLTGTGFTENPVWSPDSGKISFTDNSGVLFFIDLKSGIIKKVADNPVMPPGTATSWSPDSRWLAYSMNQVTYIQRIFLYSLDTDRSTSVTDGLSEATEPVFDASGKYLYFFASTDAGPVKQWFDLSNLDTRQTNAIYVVALTKDAPSPLAKESDEEKGAPDKAVDEKPKTAPKAEAKGKAEEAKPTAPEPVRVDFDGLDTRILALPVPPGNLRILHAGEAGQLYYAEFPADAGRRFYAAGPGASLHKYDFKSRKDEVVQAGVEGYLLSADRKKMAYYQRESWFIVPAGQKPEPGKGRINTDAITVRVVPTAEWAQIFNEAWRINRDFFYATNMHGADWKAMREKYAPFLADVSCRNDLNRVIQWMCSELGVGHHRVGGGDSPFEPKAVAGGLLGADYEIANGRYRFKKVYGGLNWNPELRSPLTEPGVGVKAGEYLLAVGGRDLRPPTPLFSLFENTADKLVEITVGPNPDGTGSRTVKVVPVANEFALRNRDWVEGNVRKVHEATNGRVAYVYVPNTAGPGHTYFKRYFFPQADKDAIIVDERFNAGGLIADYYIELLTRPVSAYWNMRYGADLPTPAASIQGPKVMLIDETAGSGGDMLPFMFRKFKVGTLVGKRTWGGLVGTLGFPVLMDGGMVTAPNLAIWTEDGFVVENVGVPPDVEVEQTPADVIAGHDPQLEAAIRIILQELEKNPPKKPKRPPYPIRGNR